MKRKFTFVSTLIVILLLTSCSVRLVDFTVISSKNHALQFDLSQGRQVKGSSNGFLGLGASIKDAMDKALQEAGSEYDILINGVVRLNDYFLISGYKVEGTAVSSRKLRAMLGEDGFKEWCKSHQIFEPHNSDIVMQ